MITNEKAIWFGILTIIAIFVSNITSADGGVFVMPDYNKHVYLPSQKAAIFWDGENETLILSTKIKAEDITNIAWVVPVQSKTKPEVEEGDIEIFYDIAELFMPAEKGGLGFDMLDKAGNEAQVMIIESKKVDIYDITILKATDANALVEWLNDNGYRTPESAIPILQHYCEQDNFYFIANKIDLKNRYKDLEITENDKRCAERIEIPQYYLGRDIEYIIEQEFEYELKCVNASLDAVKVIVELEYGISTPIKLKFQPAKEKAFYPQRMSSVNEGEIEINIYVFSKTPVEDKSDILSTSQMIKIDSEWLKEKYNLTNEKYITLLRYEGVLNELNEDSLFMETNYKPHLDPTYVSLSDMILNFFGFLFPVILFLLFFCSVIFAIFIFLPFLAGYTFEGLFRETDIENRYIHYAVLALALILVAAIYVEVFWHQGGIVILAPVIISMICGFYAAYEARKWLIITILIILTLFLTFVEFTPSLF